MNKINKIIISLFVFLGVPGLAIAGLGKSLGAGTVAGVGSGLATGSTTTGVVVGGATAGAGLLAGCAPQTVENNLFATERSLLTLSQTTEFRQAYQFHSELKKADAIDNPVERMQQYYRLAGINPNNPRAIVDFLGERDFESSHYATNVMGNLDLNRDQAVLLLESVSSSIAGDLK